MLRFLQSCLFSPSWLHGMQPLLPQEAPFHGLELGRRCFSLEPIPSTIFVLKPTISFSLFSIALGLFGSSPPLVFSTNRTVLVGISAVPFPSLSSFLSFSQPSRILSSFSSLPSGWSSVWLPSFRNHSLFSVSFFFALCALLSPVSLWIFLYPAFMTRTILS